MRNRRERVQRRRSARRPVTKDYYINGIDEEMFMEAEDRAATIILDSMMRALHTARQDAERWLMDYFDDLEDEYWEEEDEDDRESPASLAEMVVDSLDEIMPDIIKERLFP